MLTSLVTNLTFEDYLNYDDGSGFPYELVDGRLELMNPPTIQHFLIVDFVDTAFKAEIKRLDLPWLTFREAGVRTGRNKSRLSDLCVVTQEQARELINVSAVFESPQLIIVEVISPDSIKRDYRYKRSEYAAVEVPEYWIVDPLEKKISVLLLEEGLYEETVYTDNQKIISRTFGEIAISYAGRNAIAIEQVLAVGNLG
ncbi:Uma2 family endonuclease [Anabaena sp. UHCC 0399]|uniref:Uma2 family endonuclease n=1 Tax=Anabaena sp. UHCC 0399 TaxID=3110238 RepID=UPI002B21CE6C|nr:Uma2 family endonuclease [Anabaena sp. UHCC 0399]MEA5567418.1 Uma2 family endonuclease [Anabaena sp. UHCC 0399]